MADYYGQWNQKHGYKPGLVYTNQRVDYGATQVAKKANPVQQNNYVGNVLNSIRSGVQFAGNAALQAAKKTIVDEPLAYGKYFTGTLAKPFQALAKGDQEGFRRSLPAFTSTATNWLPMGAVPTIAKQFYAPTREADRQYTKVAAPVVLTAATLGSGKGAISGIREGSGALNAARNAGVKFAEGTVGTGQSFGKNGIVNIGGKLVRNELITKPTAESIAQSPQDALNIIKGQNVASSAFNLGSILAPAAITGGQKALKAGGGVAKKALFNTSGVFDNVKLKGNQSVNDAFKAFSSANKSTSPKQVKKIENELRVIQDLVLQESKGNAKLASQLMARYQSEMNKFEKLDLNQFVGEFRKLIKSRMAAQNMGFDAVGRLSVADKATIMNRLTQSKNMAKELKALQKEGVVKNTNLYGQIDDIIKNKDKAYVKSALNDLTATNPAAIKGKTADFGNGYFGILQKDAGKVRDAAQTKQIVSGKDAKLGFVGDALRKTGLSPEAMTAQDNAYAFNKFKEAFKSKIDGIDSQSGNELYKKLNKLADESLGVTDIRQLSATKIANELNVTKTEAKQIIRAAKDSYKGLTLAERGLGGKLMDFNLRVNPIAAPYSKAQSILRYEKNPFFRLQENLETRIGVTAMGGKQVRPYSGAYDDTIKKLNQKGIFTSGYGAEGADTFSGSFNGVKAKLSRDQQANIAASIEKFAGGPGKVDDWLRNPKNADLLTDFKTVVQYPDKGFTSSSLAKMMNLVAFPARYNLKVTQFAIKQFMKQPAPVQIAVIKGLGDFSEFAHSPEGIKWQADNKEAIGLLKYFTPIMPIMSVYDTLTGKNKTLGDIGLIGGLPFGVITRVLTGQGIIKDSTPYVDPKTGKVYSDRVPEDAKARVKSFLDSVIDTLYTYPGRSAGMETSKKQLTEGLTNNLTFGQLKDAKYSDVDRSQDVTPDQQRQIDILRAGAVSNQPLPLNLSNTGVRPLPQPVSYRVAALPKKKKAAKKGKVKYYATGIR